MDKEEFQQRTRAFALRIIRLVESLPKNPVNGVLGRQLLRCGTSVGANYRAACRARSMADFVAKLGIVEEEADECLYWMDLLIQSEQIKKARLENLQAEGTEILAMVVASIKTSRAKIKR